MQDQYKSIGGCGAVLMLGFSISMWVVPSEDTTIAITILRFVFPLISIGFAVLSIWAYRRPDLAPDHLRNMFGKKRFDCNGVGFAIDIVDHDGQAMLDIYYQNRRERPGQLKISIHATNSFGKSCIENISMLIQPDGAAFGCTHIPLAIADKHQGKTRRFSVQADACFPTGRGKLLRFHPGQSVGKGESKPLLGVVAVLMFGVFGALAFSGRSRSLKLRLPENVATEIPTDIQPITENLWMPGDMDDNEIEVLESPIEEVGKSESPLLKSA